MVKHKWTKLLDDWSKRAYVVVPATGHLLVNLDESDGGGGISRLAALGLSERTYCPSGFPFPLQCMDVDDPATELSEYKLIAFLISRAVKIASRLFPLKVTIVVIDALFRKSNPKSRVQLDKAIGIAAGLFGRRSRNDCLEMSLKRYALLRHLGYSPDINIGVFIPTEEMHAWVSIDNTPILECPDILMHYMIALIYRSCE